MYCGAESFVSGQDESLIRERRNVKRDRYLICSDTVLPKIHLEKNIGQSLLHG